MAASIWRVGRVVALKFLHIETWGFKRTAPSAALCSKSQEPKKAAKKNVVSTEERASLLTSRTTVGFPAKVFSPFCIPPAVVGRDMVANSTASEAIKAENATPATDVSTVEPEGAPPVPMETDVSTERAQLLQHRSYVEFPKKDPWLVSDRAKTVLTDPVVPSRVGSSEAATEEWTSSFSSSSSSSSSDSDSGSEDEREEIKQLKSEILTGGKENETFTKPAGESLSPYLGEEGPAQTTATNGTPELVILSEPAMAKEVKTRIASLPQQPVLQPKDTEQDMLPIISQLSSNPEQELDHKEMSECGVAVLNTPVASPEVIEDVAWVKAGAAPEELLPEQPLPENTALTTAEDALKEAMAPPAKEPEFDNMTYKNLQHHEYTPFTFVDYDVELAKYRLPQPSAGRISPRH
ncbi:NDUV3 dehydrogenase, partial [Amia calva]|nr:NDUV3 dehydrogenase [Amia calva]